jgi:arylformamidase
MQVKSQQNTLPSEWIDASVPLQNGLVHWPGDPEPSFQKICDMDQGSEINVTLCRFTAHTGTHMDAPCHFIAGGAGIDTFPFETGIGTVRVISLPETAVVTKADLQDKNIQKGERIILKTSNSAQPWSQLEFQPKFVGIGASGAQFLVDAGVSLIGVDYLSVGVFEGDGAETHCTLLGAGVWVVEGLRLMEISDGLYDMICLPLRIVGADGSPARVLLKRVA